MGCYSVVILFYEILDQNGPVCWRIVAKEKSTVRSPFVGAFPSDCIPKAKKSVNVTICYTQQQFLQIIPSNSGNFSSQYV